MRIFITGANGFTGSNLCRHFLAKGWQVSGLVRPTADRHFLEGLPLDIVVGDLRETGGFAIPEGLDALVHAASLVSDLAGERDCRENILGLSENLAARIETMARPPARLVAISTALVLGFAKTGISEENPGLSAEFIPYTRYKRMSEELFLSRRRSTGLPVVILRPGDIFGPRDRTTLVKILQGLEAGYPLIVGKGRQRFGYLHISNLCQAVERAVLRPGIEGRAYTVTNGILPTWGQFFGILMDGVGRRQRYYVPAGAAFAAAFVQTLVHRLFPAFTPKLNYYRVKRVTTETTYDISRTVADLGYVPDDRFEDQAREMVAWYYKEKEDGFLP
jgi:2-alkyl-3-oxoalkanoate reductase